MEELREIISTYNTEIILGVSGLSILLFILNIISAVRISKITKKYNRLVHGSKADTLENILLEHLDGVKNVKEQLIVLEKHCIKLDDKFKTAIQKIGVVRYNAFGDMGSDLSYSIALLDENLNGFVMTSLYGRNESNTYGKPIAKGKSKYELSVEEIQAVDRAIKS